MPDTSITRRVWTAVLPIEIFIALEDAALLGLPREQEVPESLFVRFITRIPPGMPELPSTLHQILARRCSLVTFYLSEVRRHFCEAYGLDLPADITSITWFESEDGPLRWHLPLGLLYDQHVVGKGRPPPLPWKLRVRFTGFPADRLIRTTSPLGFDVAQDVFINALKESDFMRHGSARKVLTLSKAEQSDMWRAVVQGDHDLYWGINAKVLDDPGQHRGIPLRLHFADRTMMQDLVGRADTGEDGERVPPCLERSLLTKDPQPVGCKFHRPYKTCLRNSCPILSKLKARSSHGLFAPWCTESKCLSIPLSLGLRKIYLIPTILFTFVYRRRDYSNRG